MKQIFAVGVVVFILSGEELQAEPLPQPATDYAAKATVKGGTILQSRYANGRMRMEMSVAGTPKPVVAYFDFKARKGVMVMSLPGMPPMAMDLGLQDESGMGVASGRGERIGSDRVAGETCDLWRIEPARTGEKAHTVGCITRDGIALRMETVEGSWRETVFQVTELSRAPQDATLLTPPANLKPMQMPKGMMPPRK